METGLTATWKGVDGIVVRQLHEEIADALHAKRLNETLDQIAQHIRELVGAHQSAVSYIPEGDFSRAVHGISLSEKYAKYRTYDVMPTGKGIWTMVFESRRPVRLTEKEVYAHPRFQNFSGLKDARGLEHPPLPGWLAVPILGPTGEPLGLLQLSDRYQGDFTPKDEALLQSTAKLIAPTMEGVYLYEQIAAQKRQLQSLNEQLQAQGRAALNLAQDAEEARKRAKQNEKALEKLNQDLQENQQRTRLIIDTAHEAFVGMDAQGIITDWNPKAEAIFGWSRQEVLGRLVADTIIPQRYREMHGQGLQRFLKSGQGPVLNQRLELPALHRDGHEFPVELTIAPMPWKGSYLFSAFIHDISERKRAEMKLKQTAAELTRSNKELELFASVASHDLQEPLRMVSSFMELLSNRYKDQLDEKAQSWIHFAVEGTGRMKQLINDLLEFSRVGTRGNPFVPTQVEEVFQNVVHNLQQAIQENGAVVSHGPLPTICADRTQLTQLLQNLIGNALKFRTAEKVPEVRVEAEALEGCWCFAVKDNGIGIDPQFSDRIFAIFQRLHTRNEYAGTGIGLAVCKKIVERHGGKIWVESRPGQGATFYFTLPAHGAFQDNLATLH